MKLIWPEPVSHSHKALCTSHPFLSHIAGDFDSIQEHQSPAGSAADGPDIMHDCLNDGE